MHWKKLFLLIMLPYIVVERITAQTTADENIKETTVAEPSEPILEFTKAYTNQPESGSPMSHKETNYSFNISTEVPSYGIGDNLTQHGMTPDTSRDTTTGHKYHIQTYGQFYKMSTESTEYGTKRNKVNENPKEFDKSTYIPHYEKSTGNVQQGTEKCVIDKVTESYASTHYPDKTTKDSFGYGRTHYPVRGKTMGYGSTQYPPRGRSTESWRARTQHPGNRNQNRYGTDNPFNHTSTRGPEFTRTNRWRVGQGRTTFAGTTGRPQYGRTNYPAGRRSRAYKTTEHPFYRRPTTLPRQETTNYPVNEKLTQYRSSDYQTTIRSIPDQQQETPHYFTGGRKFYRTTEYPINTRSSRPSRYLNSRYPDRDRSRNYRTTERPFDKMSTGSSPYRTPHYVNEEVAENKTTDYPFKARSTESSKYEGTDSQRDHKDKRYRTTNRQFRAKSTSTESYRRSHTVEEKYEKFKRTNYSSKRSTDLPAYYDTTYNPRNYRSTSYGADHSFNVESTEQPKYETTRSHGRQRSRHYSSADHPTRGTPTEATHYDTTSYLEDLKTKYDVRRYSVSDQRTTYTSTGSRKYGSTTKPSFESTDSSTTDTVT